MSTLLPPQIPRFLGIELAAKLGSASVAEARHARATDHPLKIHSATGGSHTTAGALESLRDAVEQVAREHGYPASRPTSTGAFDTVAAERIFRLLRISPNEASKGGVWLFLACILMPDIVVWRQRKRDGEAVNPDNFLDSTNNLFRRLWWRSAIFHDPAKPANPFWLLDVLLEDAIQTFYERRSLSGTPGMGTAFGRIYHATAGVLPPRYNMEPLERSAQKWLVRIAESVALDFLESGDRLQLVAEAFHRALPAEFSRTVTVAQLVVAAGGVASVAPFPPREVAVVVPAEKAPARAAPAPVSAFRFESSQLKAFAADSGSYSNVTDREASASELNLTGPEAKLAEQFFGRERIHVGPVRADPMRALQRFRLFPSGDLVYLNLVYPKPDRSEMRLYLSLSKGFKPAPGSIWFLFQKKRDLFIGSMPADEWNTKTSGVSSTP
ncbi:MAG: hypothetical protein JWM88_801 [Verrucomicrobia bacterium]|nr:hypothetical protein [Verrucomicrobiota bacterium]